MSGKLMSISVVVVVNWEEQIQEFAEALSKFQKTSFVALAQKKTIESKQCLAHLAPAFSCQTVQIRRSWPANYAQHHHHVISRRQTSARTCCVHRDSTRRKPRVKEYHSYPKRLSMLVLNPRSVLRT